MASTSLPMAEGRYGSCRVPCTSWAAIPPWPPWAALAGTEYCFCCTESALSNSPAVPVAVTSRLSAYELVVMPYPLRYFSRALITPGVWPYWPANCATDRSGESPICTAWPRPNRLRPRRMNDTVSGVLAGVVPKTLASFSAAGPMPCETATLPVGTDDGVAADDDAAIVETRAAAVPSAAAAVAATIRRRFACLGSFKVGTPPAEPPSANKSLEVPHIGGCRNPPARAESLRALPAVMPAETRQKT